MKAPLTSTARAGGQSSGPAYPVQLPTDSADAAARLSAPTVCGLYVHTPFCFHKCHYCDFYSIVDDRDRQAAFTGRLIEELRAVGESAGRPRLTTIFVGGGTPTLLRAELWGRLLPALDEAFDRSAPAEFTVEANPETVTAELMTTLAAGGVNRVSIGCQSFDERHLNTLERWHDPASVAKAVNHARAAGITNLNLDLIYAIPGQTLDEWRDDLSRAVDLGPTHLSCYALTYEPNTPMTVKLQRGHIDPADEPLETAMFETTIDTLTAAGFEHYEVSNFALAATQRPPGSRCLHNMAYWLNRDWLAVGPSASGHVRGLRWKNVPHLGRYLACGGGAPVQDVEQLDHEASIGEQLMLRLRLIDGAPNDWLGDVLSRARQQTIADLIDRGVLEQTPTHLRLTRRGLLLADAVIGELL